MSDFLKYLRDGIGIASALPFLPKFILSMLVVLLAIFLLSIFWIKTPPAARNNNNEKPIDKAAPEGKVPDNTFLFELTREINGPADPFKIKNIMQRYEDRSMQPFIASSMIVRQTTMLVDLKVNDYTYDFAIIPDTSRVSQIPAQILLIKILTSRRSIFSEELKSDLDNAMSKTSRAAVERALEFRDDFRQTIAGKFLVRKFTLAGKRSIMNKSELQELQSKNNNRENAIWTFDTLIESYE